MDTSTNNYSNWILNDQSIRKEEEEKENNKSSIMNNSSNRVEKEKSPNMTISLGSKPNNGSTTMIDGELPSIYFKPGPRQSNDESVRFSTASAGLNPFDFGEDQVAMQAAFMRLSGLGSEQDGAFRDAQQCLVDLEKDEV